MKRSHLIWIISAIIVILICLYCSNPQYEGFKSPFKSIKKIKKSTGAAIVPKASAPAAPKAPAAPAPAAPKAQGGGLAPAAAPTCVSPDDMRRLEETMRQSMSQCVTKDYLNQLIGLKNNETGQRA